MTLPTPLALATALIRAPSVTPSDHGCQSLLIRHLETMGFAIHPLRFGSVENFYARLGTGGTHLCFAGHTDVVAAGDPDRWRTPPFAAALQDGVLTGRGACDMKGALAAIVAAVARFLAGRPRFASQHSLSFLITGDEEGMATDGTVRVLAWLAERGERFDACLVGEPTSQERLGDCIKNGRRGSLNGEITLFGRRGHVAYPHLAENPIHGAMVLLDRLARLKFDAGNDHFPATAIQFTNINAGDGSTNVIPGRLTAGFNIRFSPESTPEGMEKRIRAVLDAGEVSRYALKTTPSGLPFLTTGGALLDAVADSIRQTLAITPELSTGGGTSDARFIARVCSQTVEFGLVGSTMHQANEQVPVVDLERLAIVYEGVLDRLFPPE